MASSLDDGSFPAGFLAFTGSAGMRQDGGDEVAVVAMDRDGTSAGVFTRSVWTGPSVTISRQRLSARPARALLVVAKNANVATGIEGERDAHDLTATVAARMGIDVESVIIASTGVIGRRYPMPQLRRCLETLSPTSCQATPTEVARSMMTTDTVPKVARRQVGSASVLGVAKGVGMIEPDMATMLAFAFTDAAVANPVLDRLWRRAVDETFNCLSVDTDTSTSDTAVVLASGAAGPVDEAVLAAALREVCLDLTLQLARDGEGATKLLTVTVSEARDRAQARRVAKAIVNSPLVKTAVHGADPNWGRVAMAIGKCSDDTDIDPRRVVIRFGELEMYPAPAASDTLERLAAIMSADHVDIDVELGTGMAQATVYGCDLSDGYVRINADYTT